MKKEKILNAERIKYWISVGAKASPTIHNLLISEKVIEGKMLPIKTRIKIIILFVINTVAMLNTKSMSNKK